MKLNNISDRLIYVPNRNFGISIFDGIAYPSNNANQLIGENGVKYISKKINDIIENRKEMFGHFDIEFFGLFERQYFYDLKKRIFINIQIIENSNDYSIDLAKMTMQKSSNKDACRVIKRGDLFYVQKDFPHLP
jgi:acid phosphatase class B